MVKAIKYVVDNMPFLETIIVYSVSIHDNKVLELFGYAISKGIKIVIPNNLLKTRNKEVNYGEK